MGINKMKVFTSRCWTLSRHCPAVQQTPWINGYHLLELFQYYSIAPTQQRATFRPKPECRQQIVGGKGNVTTYCETFFKEHEEGRRDDFVKIVSRLTPLLKRLFVLGFASANTASPLKQHSQARLNCSGVDFYTLAKVEAVCFLSQVVNSELGSSCIPYGRVKVGR